MSDAMFKILSDVAIALSPVLIAGLAWLAKMIADLIASKTKSELARSLLTRLDYAVFGVVKEMQQVIVNELKKANADGKLNEEEKQQIKAAVLAKLKSFISFAELGKLLSIGDVDGFVMSRVESAVHDLRENEAMIHGDPR